MLKNLLRALWRKRPAASPDAALLANIEAAALALRRRDWATAAACYEQALDLDPNIAPLYGNLGVVYREQLRLADAIACYERGLAVDPGVAELHYNLGVALQETGRVNDAERHYRRAIELRPDFNQAHSSLLCISDFSYGGDKAQALAEHLAWAARHADPLTRQAPPHANVADPERRLNIGYVSADLRDHSVAYYIEPILRAHDRANFRIFCYDNWWGEDAVNRRLRGFSDVWRKIEQLDDAAAAALIRADAIDILVDLSGHSVGNRLLVFARKPAPVQATWFGYLSTTGLAAMDYRITDANFDPPGMTEKYCSERLLRIACAVAFKPAPDSPDVNDLPALANRCVTFGSFNNYSKVTDEAVELWSRILLAVPGARLILVVLGGDEPVLRDAAVARFAAHGVPPDRIAVSGRRPLAEFLRMFHRVDVAFDPFPYSGGTTSLHTLWMGVPIVALAGDSEMSRCSSSMLRAAGLERLVATDPQAYFDIAVALASDLAALAALRAGLRQVMQRSALWDAALVTRGLEEAYRGMWRTYCTEQASRGPPVL